YERYLGLVRSPDGYHVTLHDRA
ncbi:MAG: hypothetical protein JWP82_3065, partial [Humibacillus sp.]|nr:hypothetical protein [Humibacillus sp.]